MDKKLNNLIKFKEYGKLGKLENKPGKRVVEGLNNIQTFESWYNDIDDFKQGAKNIGRKIGTTTGIIDRNSEEAKIKAQGIINSRKMKKIEDAISSYYSPKLEDDYIKLKEEGGDIFNKYIIFLDDHYPKIADNSPFYQTFDTETGEEIDNGVYGNNHAI
jgi:hypothetical protein